MQVEQAATRRGRAAAAAAGRRAITVDRGDGTRQDSGIEGKQGGESVGRVVLS